MIDELGSGGEECIEAILKGSVRDREVCFVATGLAFEDDGVEFPRFRGHPGWREDARGVVS